MAEAANHSGIYHYKYSMGAPGRITPVTTGKVVTEIQAFAILAGVKAYHIASGGVGGSEEPSLKDELIVGQDPRLRTGGLDQPVFLRGLQNDQPIPVIWSSFLGRCKGNSR